MKNKYILSVVAFLLGCYQKPSEIDIPVNQEPILKQEGKINPAVLQNGSSFLELFAAHWRLGNWGELIKLTDPESIDKYGESSLLKKYRKINLAMKLSLKSITDNMDGTYILNYQTTEFATRRMLRVKVRVFDSDSAKLIIDDLDGLFH